jgi:hypothetical protein
MTFATLGPGNTYSNDINVTAPGQILTINLSGFTGLLQPPFQIMTERFDPTAHTISVVTLAGHPLAGWRYWRVYSIGTNDVVIETGAYDQPARGLQNYVGYYIASKVVFKGWQQYLRYIQTQLSGATQGPHLQDSLGGIVLQRYSPGWGRNGPLQSGYLDYFRDFTQYILNNVCQSTSCN